MMKDWYKQSPSESRWDMWMALDGHMDSIDPYYLCMSAMENADLCVIEGICMDRDERYWKICMDSLVCLLSDEYLPQEISDLYKKMGVQF